MEQSLTTDLRYLQRPDGRIAYTVAGNGPLIVAVPGMGDLRDTWRELVGPLVDAGYRVAVTDLRGHGDSDADVDRHGDDVTGNDVLALVDELGGPAILIGNSMGASAAVWAAAERPDAVAGLVLVAPFLRNPAMPSAIAGLMRASYHLFFARPWGAGAWAGYYRSLNRGTRAPWLDEHVAAIRAALRRPGYLRAFRRLAVQLDHAIVEPRLPEVTAPALAVFGALDPDFKDARAEAEFARDAIGAETLVIDDAGHYPQTQRADLVVPRVLEFVRGIGA